MAPMSRPCSPLRSSTQAANKPTSAPVTSTPTVASESAGRKPTRKSSARVRSPPSKRMIASARLPSRLASLKSSKSMPPGPSSPASMPITRNTSRSGAPTRAENALATMLMSSSAAPKKMM